MQTKQTYQTDYNALLKRRNDANTLISGLTGEKIRWNEQNKAFELSIEKLIGNTILVTAFLSYCAPFNQDFRQNVEEEFDPILDPILAKNFSKLDRTLRLYITTNLANPTYPPEICARVSVIDFTVTQRGLEHQLLSLAIANERNERERERVKLARETTKNKRMLKELEDNLLIKLTT
ncbi:unnamed protein product [Rotaria magnacalcarata]|uniref:Dynein heavy chain ATP-binding dynein motor region domain-containing protein n=1 Tax=Rotaria magnacalcarata TaxID=392030 RepID=A0A816RR52_9BILA|nr:unnamed protein product [Rotaria magnacalcarata]